MPNTHAAADRGADSRLSLDHGFGLLFAAVSGHAACFWVFTRKDFGGHAFDLYGPLALLIMLLYGGFAPCPEMALFAAAWVSLLVVHRLLFLVNWLRGRLIHSRDDGRPWLVQAVVRPRPGDFVAKAVWEPLLAAGSGLLILPHDETLGYFVAAGSVSLAVRRLIERGLENAELQAMRDQEMEMRARIGRYRGRR